MRIVQITDLHIGLAGEDTFGVDVRANFSHILSAIQKQAVDHLVLTGDLCYQNPDPNIFQYVKDKLDATGIPYSLIAGNHDNSVQLAHAFNLKDRLKGQELYYRLEVDGLPILHLDSAAGQLSNQQKDWLKQELTKIKEDQIIFIHHPPLLANVPYMDNNHALKDRAELQQILANAAGEVHLFCGHYHIAKSIHRGPLHVHIAPSCFFQIDDSQQDFAVDHHRIAYRDIRWDGQLLEEKLVWLD